MGTAESRRTSVSSKGPEADKPEVSDKQAADSPATNGDLPVTATGANATTGPTAMTEKNDSAEDKVEHRRVEPKWPLDSSARMNFCP
jgi:hypothetical protein